MKKVLVSAIWLLKKYKMEEWNDGMMDKRKIICLTIQTLNKCFFQSLKQGTFPTLQHSNTPILQYSNTPLLQNSIIPII
ncbi:MAG: hypothetical protein JEY97_02225 [Bacteroidales bacterium]|nr:hypothetical protein [Bacteroidales bacterium]